jgi:hypothetical protein
MHQQERERILLSVPKYIYWVNMVLTCFVACAAWMLGSYLLQLNNLVYEIILFVCGLKASQKWVSSCIKHGAVFFVSRWFNISFYDALSRTYYHNAAEKDWNPDSYKTLRK